MTLAVGAGMMTVLHMGANVVQLVVGHFRSEKRRCIFLPMGLVLAGGMFFMGVLPMGEQGQVWLFGLAAVAGVGIAMAHPEGLRAVHSLKGIAPGVSSAVFLTGGFFGFSGGAWLTTELVDRGGLGSLMWLMVLPVVTIGLVYGLRIRLSTESEEKLEVEEAAARDKEGQDGPVRRSFWPLLLMAAPATVATTVIVGLVPTRLAELGFDLPFGGRTNMMFGAGGVIGAFTWSFLAKNKDEIPFCTAGALLAAPFVAVYFCFMEYPWAMWLLVGGGMCTTGAFALAVTAARHAVGPRFGLRMALMLGGSWGVGSLALMGAGYLAKYVGVHNVLVPMSGFYVLAGLVGVGIIIRGHRPWSKGRGVA